MNARKDTFSLSLAGNKKSIFLRTTGNHFGITKLVDLRIKLKRTAEIQGKKTLGLW